MSLAHLFSSVLLGAGAAMLIIGSVGINRFPHFYSRLHAAGVVDTVAAGLFLAGLALYFDPGLVTVKLLLVFVFLLFTSPTACHALARAAYSSGLREPAAGDDR